MTAVAVLALIFASCALLFALVLAAAVARLSWRLRLLTASVLRHPPQAPPTQSPYPQLPAPTPPPPPWQAQSPFLSPTPPAPPSTPSSADQAMGAFGMTDDELVWAKALANSGAPPEDTPD